MDIFIFFFGRGNMSRLPAEISLVKIYYPYGSSTMYQKNLLYNWYQILCEFFLNRFVGPKVFN